jgi:uncharacterized protein YigE (DUF2233 family)
MPQPKIGVIMRLFIFCLLLITTITSNAATVWQNLAPGIDYTSISLNEPMHGAVHAFRIDPTQYSLSLANARDYGMGTSNVGMLALRSQALVAINGGFFDPLHNPLGLRVQNGKQLNPIRPISWWGIFSMHNHRATITAQKYFAENTPADFAIQSGPRLVVNGNIPKLKDNYDARSALAIDRQGNVIIAITENAAITTSQFARILQASTSADGLNCYNALNLDGGNSSQLFAQVGKFNLLIPSFNNVVDAVVVLPR